MRCPTTSQIAIRIGRGKGEWGDGRSFPLGSGLLVALFAGVTGGLGFAVISMVNRSGSQVDQTCVEAVSFGEWGCAVGCRVTFGDDRRTCCNRREARRQCVMGICANTADRAAWERSEERGCQ